MKKTTAEQRLREAVNALRPFYKGATNVEIAARVLNNQEEPRSSLASDDLEVFAAKKKRFSTGDVMGHFTVPKGNAAAAIAILRMKGRLQPDGKAPDHTSQWRFTG
jgi:hypothetical protein